jgi:hypothetical protein
MLRQIANSVWILAALLAALCAGCEPVEDNSGDGDPDFDTGDGWSTDTGQILDTDTGPACGRVDESCCPGDTCRDSDAICATSNTDFGADDDVPTCRTRCVPHSCADEGFEEAACLNLTSPSDPLGYCSIADDFSADAALAEGNVCDTAKYANGWFCCPASMGGDSLGEGAVGDDTDERPRCGGVDLSELGQPASYTEASANGVGICLFDDETGRSICAVSCGFDDSCDSLHNCVPTQDGEGACAFFTAY